MYIWSHFPPTPANLPFSISPSVQDGPIRHWVVGIILNPSPHSSAHISNQFSCLGISHPTLSCSYHCLWFNPTLIASHLDYWNSILTGFPFSRILLLQPIFYTSARSILLWHKSTPIAALFQFFSGNFQQSLNFETPLQPEIASLVAPETFYHVCFSIHPNTKSSWSAVLLYIWNAHCISCIRQGSTNIIAFRKGS